MNREILEKFNLVPNKIRYIKSCLIVETDDGVYALKKVKNKDVYDYLESKNFTNYPRIHKKLDDYILMDYIKEEREEDDKLNEIVSVMATLHSKTCFYKEVDLNYIKRTYEDLKEQYQDRLYFYQNIRLEIEKEIYMSPSNYYLILNITNIYKVLLFGSNITDEWYKTISSKKVIRFALNHNNLTEDHIINSNIISWDRASFNAFQNDILNFYQKNFQKISLDTILDIYNHKNSLLEHEYLFLLSNICLLEKINFLEKEQLKIVNVSDLIDYTNRTFNYILKYNTNN